ncbi:DEAD-box ATP-dependent RNA helicase 16 [Cocos nucifera]|uniref:RNA helicase n=1 Tax=Cocos nucifera TaxID=13894 RepID=A0A8K0N153_COCNU|nr:DEAD-box ATP-dependent RNA helicase 16 [Cocos nucifera]
MGVVANGSGNRDDGKEKEENRGEQEEEMSFEELGVDPRLIRALSKKSITKPTPIQHEAIPLILEGKDVVARAKTGSGKTFAYILPMLQKLFSESRSRKNAPSTFILVPTRELCQQSMALAGPPDIVVSTPACISTCMSKGVLQTSNIKDSLSLLILDEADLLLSYGYEDDLKALIPHVPRRCQCLLMSATSSSDVEKLKKLVLHNPVILTLSEVGNSTDDIIPKNVQQFWISCNAHDKLLYILALLKFELIQKKVLIFVNSIDMGYRLKLFLEQFGINSGVLNAELPQNSRLHILEFGINSGVLNAELPQNSRLHILEVVNLDMPQSSAGYVHRIGRTGRAYNTGASVSLVSPEEEEIFEEIKLMLGDDENQDSSKSIEPFPLLTKNAVESLRYRAEDVAKGVTKVAIREARAQDLRNEILNSEKLKAHFEDNPRDLDLLKHDKLLSKKAPSSHLCDVPEYLLDPTTKEASRIVKLSRAAMKIDTKRQRPGFKKGFGRSRDPLKTFSAENKASMFMNNDLGKMNADLVNDIITGYPSAQDG